jgi:hypothetical protein
MRVAHTCVSVLVTVLMVAAAARAAETACWNLKHHCGSRDTAAYDFGLSARAQVEERASGEVEISRAEMRIRMKCLAEYVSGADGGLQRVIGRILSGTLRGSGEEMDVSHDLGETVVQYLLTPRGEVKRHDLTSGDPPAIFFSGVTLVFDPEDAFLADGVGVLPDHPVEVGDSWEGIVVKPGPAGGRAEEVAFKSTLLGVEDFRGRRSLKIKTASAAELTESAPIPGTSITAHMASTLRAEHIWRFDPERGIILSDQGSIDVLVCERARGPDGDTRAMDTSAIIRTRSVLTEFNGRKVGAG